MRSNRLAGKWRGRPESITCQSSLMSDVDMDKSIRIWDGDWRARLYARIHSLEGETVCDFLARFPAEPYISVAEMLGDFAAVQVAWLQFGEGKTNCTLRSVAMDSLTRDF